MTMYDRIEFVLNNKHITKAEMSKQTGISYNTIMGAFRRQSQNVRLETLKKIAAFLGVTVDWLVLGYEPEESKKQIEKEEKTEEDFSHLDAEIMRTVRKLSIRNKTILLAYAYGLEDKEQPNE